MARRPWRASLRATTARLWGASSSSPRSCASPSAAAIENLVFVTADVHYASAHQLRPGARRRQRLRPVLGVRRRPAQRRRVRAERARHDVRPRDGVLPTRAAPEHLADGGLSVLRARRHRRAHEGHDGLIARPRRHRRLHGRPAAAATPRLIRPDPQAAGYCAHEVRTSAAAVAPARSDALIGGVPARPPPVETTGVPVTLPPSPPDVPPSPPGPALPDELRAVMVRSAERPATNV